VTKNTLPTAPAPIKVEEHLGLAHLACQPYRQLAGRGFDYDDMFQAACESLLESAEGYDPRLGAFSTYALPRARRAVKRLVATQARTVAVPEYAQDAQYAAGRPQRPAPASPRARRTSGGAFDWAAPGASLGGPVPVPTELVPYAGVPSTWTATAATGPVHPPTAERSLDFVLGDDGGDTTLHDVLAADGPGAEDLVLEHEVRAWRTCPRFRAALDALTAPERVILVGRLEGNTQPTIAASFGVTKQRIMQIEASAVRKMRGLLVEELTAPLH
jgi:RNA polymerase sigma factor (sigma-70 family)